MALVAVMVILVGEEFSPSLLHVESRQNSRN